MSLPVVVLAGGLATRLHPYTEKTPKSLIEINGKPFVLHQLHLLHSRGITEIHFCLGYLGEMVKDLVDKSIFPKIMNITYSFDGDKLLDTGGAIKKALPELADVFFVTYGDSFLELDHAMVESVFFKTAGEMSGLMTVYKNGNKYDTSNAVFENNRVIYYSKKLLTGNMEYIDYGMGILRKNHFDEYPEDVPFALSEVYESLSLNGRLLGYESTERFYEIGSLTGIKELEEHLKSKKL